MAPGRASRTVLEHALMEPLALGEQPGELRPQLLRRRGGGGCGDGGLPELGLKRPQGERGIAQDGDGGHGVAGELIGLDVDADQLAGELEPLLEQERIGFAELGADRQHHIGRGERRRHRRLGQSAAERERMAGRQDALRR